MTPLRCCKMCLSASAKPATEDCAGLGFCGGHGRCAVDGHCECDEGWEGDACAVASKFGYGFSRAALSALKVIGGFFFGCVVGLPAAWCLGLLPSRRRGLDADELEEELLARRRENEWDFEASDLSTSDESDGDEETGRDETDETDDEAADRAERGEPGREDGDAGGDEDGTGEARTPNRVPTQVPTREPMRMQIPMPSRVIPRTPTPRLKRRRWTTAASMAGPPTGSAACACPRPCRWCLSRAATRACAVSARDECGDAPCAAWRCSAGRNSIY